MKVGGPTILFFLVSLALVIAGVLGHVQPARVPAEFAQHKFWLVTGGWGALVLGLLFRPPSQAA